MSFEQRDYGNEPFGPVLSSAKRKRATAQVAADDSETHTAGQVASTPHRSIGGDTMFRDVDDLIFGNTDSVASDR